MKDEAASESMRLFVAVELPEAWKRALAGLQDDMLRALAAESSVADVKVRWVRPEGIHLTLKFLGQVSVSRLPAIQEALAASIPAAPEIEISMARAGSFSDRRAPRVILATINVAGEPQRLLRLVEGIETWLAAAGFPRERRAFAPHLTLARLPEELPASLRLRVAEITTAVAVPDVAALSIGSVSLIRSHLGRDGARYERLASFPGVRP